MSRAKVLARCVIELARAGLRAAHEPKQAAHLDLKFNLLCSYVLAMHNACDVSCMYVGNLIFC